MPPGFDLAGVCPLVRINLALASLVCRNQAAQEKL